ncbi:MAG: biotin-dependent carboxyltransferase family protein [Armatimonadetes bacterium]|nr:biotin-dependent carboxyltransferase family protein [Armatimonadota bacterium]
MKIEIGRMIGIASLEDAGRPGRRKHGVPPGGAFDRESFALANALVRNDLGAPSIEFALGTLEFEALEAGAIAVVGGARDVSVDEKTYPARSLLQLRKGDRVEIGPPVVGLRTYVAAPGGWCAKPILGSASGTIVDSGDVLCSAETRSAAQPTSLADEPASMTSRRLRYIGPDEALHGQYQVTREINRVGLRLRGTPVASAPATEISEPSVFGSIQASEDGTIMIHGPDGPTIGGYRKLGTIIRADLDRLGQLMAGAAVYFERTTCEAAQEIWGEDELRRSSQLKLISLLVSGH